MLIGIFAMLAYAVILAISSYGYGRLCALFSGMSPLDVVTLSVLGIDFIIVIGGVMNLLSIISTTTLTMLAMGGLIAAFLPGSRYQSTAISAKMIDNSMKSTRRQSHYAICGMLVLICVTTMIHWGFPPELYTNPSDDNQAYLVFPLKMLVNGSLGLESFSERRMVTGLGGNSFLQALVLSWLPLNCITLIEPGLAKVLLALGVFTVPRKNLPRSVALLTACAIVIFPVPRINTTSLLLPTLQLVVLYRTLRSVRSSTQTWRYAVLHGLQLAALAAMKSTLIPVVGLWIVILFGFNLVNRSSARRAPLYFGTIATACTVLLLPWMWASMESFGTALYPVLGKGLHRTAYEPYRVTLHTMTTAIGYGFVLFKNPLCICTLLLFLCGLHRNSARQFRMPFASIFSPEAIALTLATFGGIIAMWFAVGGVGLDRYAFSSLFATFLVLAYELYVTPSRRPLRQSQQRWTALAMVCVLLGHGYSDVLNEAMMWVSRALIPVFDAGRQNRELRKHEYKRLFEAVPLNERVLARLVDPYLCDFSTHEIYIADWPGMVSPPPGMPVGRGGEALAAYLLENGIRYVAYSYRQEAGFPRADPEIKQRMKAGANLWVATTARLALAFQDDVTELMETRRNLSDNGEAVVLDLARSRK